MNERSRSVLRACGLVAVVASLVIALLAISRSCARRSADRFVGTAIMRGFPYMEGHLTLWGLRTRAEGMSSPKWTFRYGTAFSEGFDVEVSLRGEVTGCSARELRNLVGLPEDEKVRRREAFARDWTNQSGSAP
jgi:hypothetical protein